MPQSFFFSIVCLGNEAHHVLQTTLCDLWNFVNVPDIWSDLNICTLSFEQELDLEKFEELFKTKAQGPVVDLSCTKTKASSKAVNKVQLLDSNRSKNLAITLRKANKTTEEICKAIQMWVNLCTVHACQAETSYVAVVGTTEPQFNTGEPHPTWLVTTPYKIIVRLYFN